MRGASYPVLLRKRRASVKGVILDAVTAAERDRLFAYEGDDGYELMQAVVELPRRRLRRIFLFRPSRGACASNPPWSFPGWRLRHKRWVMMALADRRGERTWT